MKRTLFYCIQHSMKIGYVICIFIVLIAMAGIQKMPFPNQSWIVNFLALCAFLVGLKFIFGGWSAYSTKWMVISCIMSIIGAEIMIISKMVEEGRPFSIWICLIPIVIGAISGYTTYKWVNNILDDTTSSEISLENVVDSVFDNGLKNTFWGIMDSYSSNMYYACGRGVAVFSNMAIFSGFITMVLI